MARWAIEFQNISRSFFGVQALKDVTLAVRAGKVLGLVGENGAGKSTLVNVLGGVVPPHRGSMKLFGEAFEPACPADATRAGIAFIHQELNLFANLSIADNLFIDGFPRLGKTPLIDGRGTRRKVRALLEAVDLRLPPPTPVEALTPGEKQLVEIAKALGRDSRIIIFDEPTTSLTAVERKRLFDLITRLNKQGRTIIYISHTLEDVLRLSDDIAVLRDGSLVASGPSSSYSIDGLIAEMVGRRIEQLYPPRRNAPGTETVFEVRNLTQPGIFKAVSFKLRRGEIVGLFGLMGSGRTELARAVFGLDPFKSGSILVKNRDLGRPSPAACIRHGLAFVTENRREEGLLLEAGVLENLDLLTLRKYARPGSLGFMDRTKTAAAARRIAEKLTIRIGGMERQPVRNLSGGNQQKVVIGRWLLADPTVLILDEPTRGIDVGAKCEIYRIVNALVEEGASVLFISSELEELTGMADRILVMRKGEITGAFPRGEYRPEAILQAAFSGQSAPSALTE